MNHGNYNLYCINDIYIRKELLRCVATVFPEPFKLRESPNLSKSLKRVSVKIFKMSYKALHEVGPRQRHARLNNILRNLNQNAELRAEDPPNVLENDVPDHEM